MDLRKYEKSKVNLQKQTGWKTHLYHICKESSTQKIYNSKYKENRELRKNGSKAAVVRASPKLTEYRK